MLRVIARLNLGGPAHQAAYLSGRRFDPERFETLLVHGRLAPGEESMADLAREEGARMIHLPTLRQPIEPPADARAFGALIRIVNRFRPHIVHSHTAKAGLVARAAALAAPGRRPALVHTFHGHVLEGYFGPAKTRLFRDLERALGRRTDRLIGVSEATVDDLVRLGVAPRERFEVIPLGLDLSPYEHLDPGPGASLRRELGVADDQVLAVFVGRVVPIKRLDVLLRALAVARSRGAKVHLAVVGDGEMRPDLERLARELRTDDAVHFLGYRRDLAPVLSAADLAVLSSDNEGTPVSLIEAGAAGVPAVATDVGGVAEVVEDGGWLVAPRDPDRMGVALAELAGDGARRRRMGKLAQERALREHGVDRLIDDVSGLYRALRAGRG